jgi:hypothetical protein
MNIRPDITPSPVRPRETGDPGAHDVTHLSLWIPACARMSELWFPRMSGVRFTALSEAW